MVKEPRGPEESDSPPPPPPSGPSRNYLAVVLPLGLALIWLGLALIPDMRGVALGVLALGTLATVVGKMAVHHTLAQPIGLLLLFLGIVLLILRPFMGPPVLMTQLALGTLLPGVILAAGKAGF